MSADDDLEMPVLTTQLPAILFKLAPWRFDDDRDLPRQGYGYRSGLSDPELYDSTRAWWALDPDRARQYRYAVAVRNGVTVGVWEIDHRTWREARPETARRLGASQHRWAFEASDPSNAIVAAFVGRRVPTLRPGGVHVFGRGSVVAYWPS